MLESSITYRSLAYIPWSPLISVLTALSSASKNSVVINSNNVLICPLSG